MGYGVRQTVTKDFGLLCCHHGSVWEMGLRTAR